VIMEKNNDVLETMIGGGDPAAAERHYTTAMQLEQEGFRVGAINELRKAVSVGANPNHIFKLAYLLDLVGEESESTHLYEELATNNLPHMNVLLNLSVVYEDKGKINSAEKCLQQILVTDPTHKRARLYLKDVQSSAHMYYDEDIARDAAKNTALMNTPVTDFELSVRARNCLKRMQIRTLGDLLKISESELLSYKNFGETSLTEIKQMLTARGMRLGQGVDGQSSQIHQERYEELLSHTSEQVLSKPVSSLNLSVRARKALQLLNIQTIADLAVRTEAELLGIKNFGSTSLIEIYEGLKAFGLELREID